MGVRFLIGRAGTGKSRRIFDAIAGALREDPVGTPIYWIVPKQATFMAERELTCAGGLGGFCRARVVSFEQLAQEVLEECGGAAVPEVNDLGRQMVLGLLLRQNEKELKFFSKVARQPGLAAKLEATLCEFERAGREANELASVVEQLQVDQQGTTDADPDLLRAKLQDLQLLYTQYTAYLGQDRIDPRRRVEQVLGCMNASKSLRGAKVFIDGFTEFTDSERRMIARMGVVAGSVEIALLMDPDSPALLSAEAPIGEMGVFHRVEQTYRRVVAACRDEGAEVEKPVALREVRRFSSESLRAVEREAFSEEVTARERDGSVTFTEAPDRRAEVDHVARSIRKLLAEGLRLRDVVVLVRSLEVYADLIHASFREHDLPYFVDRRRTMAHHPLLRFVRAALSVVRHHWRHDAAMALIKTGLAGLGEEEADRLENYVLEHRLRGTVWVRDEPWKWRRRLTKHHEDGDPIDRNEAPEMDALRRKIADAVGPFAQLFAGNAAVPVRQVVTELFWMMDRFGVRAALATWVEEARRAKRHEQAGEHEQVWAELVALFDQMVELIGGETVTLADFQEILEAGLETFDLAITPPTVDQVLVGQVDRTRTGDVRACFVLGLNEGVFPYAPRDVSILSDAERWELHKHQFEVEPDSQRKLLDETLLGYVAFTRASGALHVSRASADDAGRALGASAFWSKLRAMFPAMEVKTIPRDERNEPTLIGTPRQLITTLMKWVRSGTPASETRDPRPSLYQWLVGYPTKDDPIGNLRHRAWKALSYDNSAWLTEPIAKTLFPRPLKLGVNQVEAFATCPFRHFLRYGLRLVERDDDETPELDLESAYHHILEDLVRRMLNRKADWRALTPEQCGQIVHAYAEKVAESLSGELMLSNPRNRYLLARIEKTLEQVICNQQAVAKRGQFKTGHAKVEFGGESEKSLPALVVPTPGGEELHLTGKIDRVDVLEEQAAAAVIDYRLFGGDLQLGKVQHGLGLQLLVYLLVIDAHGEHLTGKKLAPAAAFYVRLLRQLELVDHPEEGCEPDDPKFPLRGKQRGIFDTTYFDALDGALDLETRSSDVVAARRKSDGTFGYRSVTDVADPEELKGLLEETRRVLGRIGEQMLSGVIDIAPYRLGTKTPCSYCDYRSVCRFDPSINRYHAITVMKRDEVLAQVRSS